MSVRRLLARVPSAVKLGSGILGRHELRFHKPGSVDGTAKCDVTVSADPQHRVYGVVYHMACAEQKLLHEVEGLGRGYEQKLVTIRLLDGRHVVAFTYFATQIDAALKPLDWYLEHVLTGARENRLPEAYISAIAAIESIADTDQQRRQQELAIYN